MSFIRNKQQIKHKRRKVKEYHATLAKGKL